MKNTFSALVITLAVLLACFVGIFVGRNLPEQRVDLLNEAGQTIIASVATESKININTATKEELMMLPGIGETIAERILLFRQETGTFTTTFDLLQIKELGTKTLESIQEFITVGG